MFCLIKFYILNTSAFTEQLWLLDMFTVLYIY